MLVIYVALGLLGFLVYTLVRIKVQQWQDDSRMRRLSLKRFDRMEEENENHTFTSSHSHEIYEITDDESNNSVTAEVDEADNLHVKDKGERSRFKRSTMSKFDESTDSLESNEEVTLSQPGTSSSMFTWDQEHRNKSIKNYSKERKKYKSMYDDHSEGPSDEAFMPRQDQRFSNGKRTMREKKKFIGAHDSKNVEELGVSKRERENTEPEVTIQREKTIGGIKVKIPVEPYACQNAVMDRVICGCRKAQNCLLESPTGSGKTLALLCSVLAWQEHFAAEPEKELDKKMQDASTYDDIHQKGDCENFGKRFTDPFNHASKDGWDSSDEDLGSQFKVPKIYYGTRTHKQIEQVIRELKKTAYKHKKMTILGSREHTCIQNSKRNKTELCNELLDPTKHTGCPYYKEENKRTISTFNALKNYGIDSAWDIEDLVTLGREKGACPYFAAKNLMKDADIIFCPYNYLIDPDIRESMQLDIKNQVIILDEAHNIEEICRDVASVNFRLDHLVSVAQECKSLSGQRAADAETYNTLEKYIMDLVNFINNVGLSQIDSMNDDLSSEYWKGAELKELFNMNNIGDTRYANVVAAGNAAISDYNKAKEDIRGIFEAAKPAIVHSSKRILQQLIFMIQMICSEEYVNDYRACVIESIAKDVKHVQDDTWYSVRNYSQRVRTLKLICMNPGVIFSPLALATRCIILASGTLTPTTSFQSELSTKFPIMLSANHVIPKDQVYAICVKKGPNGISLRANHENVNSWKFQDELGRLLLDVCESVPHGVLCFFSSYRVMNTQINRWKNNSIWEKIKRYKCIFMEPRYGGDLAQVMMEYRNALEATAKGPKDQINGALLFAVFRGKVAEGIDFSDNDARCILTIGIPYAVRKDPVIDMKYKYNDMNSSAGLLSGQIWYNVQAFRALNQALGRCVRHINDWGAVLLVDERIPSMEQYLPKWIKSMCVNPKEYNLKEDLRKFVAKQKAREAQNGIVY